MSRKQFTKCKRMQPFTDILIIGIETVRNMEGNNVVNLIETISKYSVQHVVNRDGNYVRHGDIVEVEGFDIFATILQHFTIGRNTLVICNNSLVFIGSSDFTLLLENDIYKIHRNELDGKDLFDDENLLVENHQFIVSAPPTIVSLTNCLNKNRLTIIDIANLGVKNIQEFFMQFDLEYTKEFPELAGCLMDKDSCHTICISMYLIFKKYWQLCKREKLGGISLTYASQAMRAYRSSHYDNGIVKHDNEIAAYLEEKCYVGGRQEARYIGRYQGRCYLLDINSLYPSIGRTRAFPKKLAHVIDGNAAKKHIRENPDGCYFAHCKLNTREGRYSVKRDNRNIFPIGLFEAFLCGTEFTEAYKLGHIEEIYQLAEYETGNVLKSYSDHMLSARSRYKRNGDKVSEHLIKYITNGLWGKFAEIGSRWIVDNKVNAPYTYGGFKMLPQGTSEEVHYRVINGIASKLCRAFWVDNTFTAVSAFMNAECRSLLWRYMQFAGLTNVLYCGIDALIVTEDGFNNLQPFVSSNPHDYGKFKISETAEECYIAGNGVYRIGNKIAYTGVANEDTYRYKGFWNVKADFHTLNSQTGTTITRIAAYQKPTELRNNLGKEVEELGNFTSPVSLNETSSPDLVRYDRRFLPYFHMDDYLK